MSSNVDADFDPSSFKLPPLEQPAPPYYTEVISRTSSADTGGDDQGKYSHGPWLLRRTSIHVESTPSNLLDDQSSDCVSIATTKNDEKRAVRNLLARFGARQLEEHRDDRSSMADSCSTNAFGTTVTIEASQPRKVQTKQREMKGLEEAASVRRWIGNGQPAEAWGKLIKDPELWDPTGNVLAYFSYQRPHPSFRLQSSMLESTQSDVLISKLQDGLRRTSRSPSVQSPRPAFANLSLDDKRRPGMPARSDSTFSGTGGHIQYEIHFPPPDEGSKTNVLRHHITTRNFIAMLMSRPLVGMTLYQALVDLHQRLQMYMPQSTDCTQLLVGYLKACHLRNVCNDPAAAAGLLCWSEDTDVQWQEGWREGFVHCCGMYPQLKSLPEFRDISQTSRSMLEHADHELRARIRAVENRLSCFNFDDMWVDSEVQLHPSRAVFDQFRRFLHHHYEKVHKRWPPVRSQEGVGNWLTRNLVLQLQQDFAALYEYHVDRGVVWEKSRKPGRSHKDIIRKADGKDVESNKNHLCLASLFTRFEQRHKFVQIPHPFPLLPALTLIDVEPKQSKSRLFSSKSKALEKRLVQAYGEASNASLLGPETLTNHLLEAFLRFEKTDSLGDANPQSARKARWMLLHGVLQVLSTVSVDTPGLFFEGDVSYFLNPLFRNVPTWKTDAPEIMEGASPTLSHCWTAPSRSWGESDQTN